MTPPLLLITHNWRESVRRQLSWQTEILVARAGNEQRRRLRGRPSETLSYVMTFMDAVDGTAFLGAMANAPDLQVEFPRWEDELSLTAAVTIAATSLALSDGVIGRHFNVTRRVLLFRDAQNYEIVTVGTSANPLLVSATAKAWGIGTSVVPLETGRIVAPVSGSDLGSINKEPLLVLVVDEDMVGINTTGGGAVALVATVVNVYNARDSTFTSLPFNGVLMLYVEAFGADGLLIPDPVVTWSFSGSATISVYPSGRSGYAIVKHNGTPGAYSGTVTATVNAASGTYGV